MYRVRTKGGERKGCKWIGEEGVWENTEKAFCFKKLLFPGYIYALILFYIQYVKSLNI